MGGNPLLSVCVPTYNRGRVLADRVRAWLRALPQDFEIVVSDNASADDTSARLAALNDPRLRFVRNDKNVGSFENQLRAFEAARGRYLLQLTDKDDLTLDRVSDVREALLGLKVVCGELTLNGDSSSRESVSTRRGIRAFRRHGLNFTHPSGHFFSAEALRHFGILARLRALPPETRPYSTDYLVSLVLPYGDYGVVDIPFVKMNLPPYEGVKVSVSYRDPGKYYFTPEALADAFAAYVRFLGRDVRMPVLSRMQLVSHLAGGAVFDQMTGWYRWRLEDDATCAWYGMRPEFRARERMRDLEADATRLLTGLREIGGLMRLAVRMGVWKRGRKKTVWKVPDQMRREK